MRTLYHKRMLLIIGCFLALAFLLSCNDSNEKQPQPHPAPSAPPEVRQTPLPTPTATKTIPPENTPQPTVIHEVDYSNYFKDLNGCAVFYTPGRNEYAIYNEELSGELKSPCSTFKIISSLIGLESGVINPKDSVREWSGETFWNAGWNGDINFADAFKTSCVWYFRGVIDDMGKETVQTALDALGYGNCDISDWEGRLNANNTNRALTGFWIESSLKISPKEQVEVMARIFENPSAYSQSNLHTLKEVMRLEPDLSTQAIYGKTGSGKRDNVWADAWYVGFIEGSQGNTYFALYLEKSQREISSALAKEIAVQIAGDHFRS